MFGGIDVLQISNQYRSTLELALTTTSGVFDGAVTRSHYEGNEAKVVDRVGMIHAEKVISKNADTPLMKTPHDARWVYPADFAVAEMIDRREKLRMLKDPTSTYVRNAVEAIRRRQDDEILGAFLSPARTGEKGSETTNFDKVNQVIKKDYAGSASGCSADVLIKIYEILLRSGADPHTNKFCVGLTAWDRTTLLKDEKVISGDYNLHKPLADGKLPPLLGIHPFFVEATNSNVYKNAHWFAGGGPHGQGTIQKPRKIPFWTQRSMHLGVWEELEVDVSKRKDKNLNIQIYAGTTVGGTRLNEKEVGYFEVVDLP